MQKINFISQYICFFFCSLMNPYVSTCFAENLPQVPENYKKFFFHYVDERTISEKILNSIGFTNNDIGRGFALIASVSEYPSMIDPLNKRLNPAAEDAIKLCNYFKEVEGFDEIVIIENENMTYENLQFFLQDYFPKRLKKFPKSRFIFAYSGHGFNEGSKGYLLLNAAQDINDKKNALQMDIVYSLFEEVIEPGYYVLALINACYSGKFLKRTFSGSNFIPRHKGAHAITAGGSSELTWSNPDVGSGSVFFEKLLAGLNGQADILPQKTNGDGIIDVAELFAYLKQEVQLSTDQNQNPQSGDLSRDGSRGSFFFLNRERQLNLGNQKKWDPNKSISFNRNQVLNRDMKVDQQDNYGPLSRNKINEIEFFNNTILVEEWTGHKMSQFSSLIFQAEVAKVKSIGASSFSYSNEEMYNGVIARTFFSVKKTLDDLKKFASEGGRILLLVNEDDSKDNFYFQDIFSFSIVRKGIMGNPWNLDANDKQKWERPIIDGKNYCSLLAGLKISGGDISTSRWTGGKPTLWTGTGLSCYITPLGKNWVKTYYTSDGESKCLSAWKPIGKGELLVLVSFERYGNSEPFFEDGVLQYSDNKQAAILIGKWLAGSLPFQTSRKFTH